MKLQTVLLSFALAASAQVASAQTYVFNGDIGYQGTASVGQLGTLVEGSLEVGFNHNLLSSPGDYGVQLHPTVGGDFFFFNPNANTATYSTNWSAGNTVFSFSLSGTGDVYSGIFDDGVGDPVIGSGSFSLSFTSTNQYAATNPGEWSGLGSQLEYSPDANGNFALNPFVNLNGSFSATIDFGVGGIVNYNFDLGYMPGMGRYIPTYSTPLNAVPEPSTYGMIGAGVIAALIAFRRFRARR